MDVLCLDLEGVLIPEIWIGVAEKTGIEALRKTTRDIPVYDDLMRLRLGILDAHRIDLATIHSVIDTLEPLPGALEFPAMGARAISGGHRLRYVLRICTADDGQARMADVVVPSSSRSFAAGSKAIEFANPIRSGSR